MNKTHYETLEVDPEISFEELKRVYHNLALKWHPDKWSTKSEEERKVAEQKFKEISVAYKEILEERQKNLTKVDDSEERTEKTKTTTDADSEKLKEELKRIDEELEEILKTHALRCSISREIHDKLAELVSHGGKQEELDPNIWAPYGNLFAKLWSNSLGREGLKDFKNQLFAAIEEEIKKAKDKKVNQTGEETEVNQTYEVKMDFTDEVFAEELKKTTEQLNKKVEDSKKELNLSTATVVDLPKIRDEIAKFNSWKNSDGNLGQNGRAFEENTAAKSYLEELQKKEKELEKSSEVANQSPEKEVDKKPPTSEQSNQLSKQEIENFKNQIQNFQNQLNQLQIQIQLLLISQNNENQIQQIQEQLNAFQKQIQDLENKPNIPNNPDLQLSKQKLVSLGNQAQQLQKNLQVKQAKEKEQRNIQQPPQKEFNWLYVVIPMGVVIIGLLFLLLSREKSRSK